MRGVIYSASEMARLGFDQRQEIVYGRRLVLVARVQLAIP
jgi:hypothetical protein